MGVSSLKPPGVKPSTDGDSGKTQYEDLGPGALSGNLTKEPELAYTPAGRAVATLRVADTPRVQDPETKKWSDGETEYWDVIVFGDQAEHVCESLTRGDRVVCLGQWQRQKWVDKEGEPREQVKLAGRDVGASLLFNEVRVSRARKGRRQT